MGTLIGGISGSSLGRGVSSSWSNEYLNSLLTGRALKLKRGVVRGGMIGIPALAGATLGLGLGASAGITVDMIKGTRTKNKANDMEEK